jgi:hypothetical protein
VTADVFYFPSYFLAEDFPDLPPDFFEEEFFPLPPFLHFTTAGLLQLAGALCQDEG